MAAAMAPRREESGGLMPVRTDITHESGPTAQRTDLRDDMPTGRETKENRYADG